MKKKNQQSANISDEIISNTKPKLTSFCGNPSALEVKLQ